MLFSCEVELRGTVPEARLAWYEVKRYGKYGSDLLAAFKLFLVSKLIKYHYIIIIYYIMC